MELLHSSRVRGARYPDDFVELTGLDVLTGHLQIHGLYHFQRPPDLKRLESALSRALDRHPAFGGSLARDGPRQFLHRNNVGVPLTVYYCDTALQSIGRPALSVERSPLISSCDTDIVFDSTTPVTGFQVTLFRSGGWALAVRNTHSVGDGAAFTNLLQSWASYYGRRLPPPGGVFPRQRVASLARGGGQRPAPDFAILPASNFNLAQRRTLNQSEFSSLRLELRASALQALVRHCRSASNARLSSSDVLHALVWKAFARSREEDDFEPSQIYSAFDLRRLPALGVPASYLGNAVLERSATSRLQHLRRGAVAEVAAHYRASVKPVLERDVRRNIAFLQREYEAGHTGTRGGFSHFVRASMVDCLLGSGIFVNDLRFLHLRSLRFDDSAVDFETVPALGFTTAFLYAGVDGNVVVRLVDRSAALKHFGETLTTLASHWL